MKQIISYGVVMDATSGKIYLEGDYEENFVKMEIKGREPTHAEKLKFTNKLLGGE